jgi:molybdate transport repressor ModE-like protein
MLDLRRLQILRAVAREGSLAGAARELSYSTPAVWQQMQRLEEEAGTALIVRHARGVRLTAAGTSLVAHAEELIARAEAAEADLRRVVGAHLRVAAFASASAVLVGPAIARLAMSVRDAELRLDDAEPAAALQRVGDGSADLAVVYAYGDAPPAAQGISTHHLIDEPLAVVLPAGHALADEERVAPELLAGDRWLRGRHGPAAATVAAGAAVRYGGEGFDTVKRLVAAGAGVAVIPRLALEPLPPGVVARPTTGRRRIFAALPAEGGTPMARRLLGALAGDAHALASSWECGGPCAGAEVSR